MKIQEDPSTPGEKLADAIARFGGSWTFIIVYLSTILAWILINAFFLGNQGYDPYPFILLNLLLSCLAALQAPIIMMSQNRQEQKDRQRAELDLKVNQKAEREIRESHHKVDEIKGLLQKWGYQESSSH